MTKPTPSAIEDAARAMHSKRHGDWPCTPTDASRLFLEFARAALSGDLGDMVLVPREPGRDAIDRAVAFALNVTISGDYNWSAYMRDVYRAMISVESRGKDPEEGATR